MRALQCLLFIACFMGLATEAVACRQAQPSEETLKMRSVIASVEQSEVIDDSRPYVWRIVARPIADDGKTSKSFTFTTVLYVGGCGKQEPPPAGERWVLYFDPASPDEVVDAFPLRWVASMETTDQVRITEVSEDPHSVSGVLARAVTVSGSIADEQRSYLIPFMRRDQPKPQVGQTCAVTWRWHSGFDWLTASGTAIPEGRVVDAFDCAPLPVSPQ